MKHSIAIVGMACHYPDAKDPKELWENVLSERRAFRRIPTTRLNLDDYYNQDNTLPDHIYITQGAFIKDYEFDRIKFKVAGSTYRVTDLVHWLALDIADKALADAGFEAGQGLPHLSTGVIIGNTLTGEFSRSNIMRLRWPYVRRVLENRLIEEGWNKEQRLNFLSKLEQEYKAPFSLTTEESLAGGLANTIAGRICNHFNLKGGGYTVDGACSSSLLAIKTACLALVNGDLDVAITGGVDLSIDPFELVGFAKTGALAKGEMRVYDTRSAGFWPGEGCGMIVLMREKDAIDQNHRIYALIKGWGVSSDGSGGITRPETEGQILALQRAYAKAGFSINDVPYFEGHGTGTTLGDATELKTLNQARANINTNANQAVISSIKANIGHTKAAAGIAGLIKATMALYTQIIPPTTACTTPQAEISKQPSTLKALTQAKLWSTEQPLKAGVSAMGFGGINAHLVLEGASTHRREKLSVYEESLLFSSQDVELFLLGATTTVNLLQQIEHLLSFVYQLSRAELTDLATELSRTLQATQLRAAIVATTPTQLHTKLKTLKSWLQNNNTQHLDIEAGLFLGSEQSIARLGFVFSGQGSVINEDGGALRKRFKDVADLYSNISFTTNGHHPHLNSKNTIIAQPAIIRNSIAALRILNKLNIQATIATGHSLGELTALHWADALDEESLLKFVKARGTCMAQPHYPPGNMVSIAASATQIEAWLNNNQVCIACFNAPNQTIISGTEVAVADVEKQARQQGLKTKKVAVSRAFHSPLVAHTVPKMAEYLKQIDFKGLKRTVVSTVSGNILSPQTDLVALLCKQITAPVLFTQAIKHLDEHTDLLFEVGPGEILTPLVKQSIATPIIPLNAGGSSLRGLLNAVAAAYCLGIPVNHQALFNNRFSRPFDLNWQANFLANPCEQAPLFEDNNVHYTASATASTNLNINLNTHLNTSNNAVLVNNVDETLANKDTIFNYIRHLIAQRIELPPETIGKNEQLLSDLHLNSIMVSQLIVNTAQHFKRTPPVSPTDYADATLAEVVEALEQLPSLSTTQSNISNVGGIDTWVQSFELILMEQTAPQALATNTNNSSWQLISPNNYPYQQALKAALDNLAGIGIAVCLVGDSDSAYFNIVLNAIKTLLTTADSTHFVLIQHNYTATALAKTLTLEHPQLAVSVINLPLNTPKAVQWIIDEIKSSSVGYQEAHYTLAGKRYQPVLQYLPHNASITTTHTTYPVGSQDVILITGGGKGITAECALALAIESGAKLALVGRSKASHDAELDANLKRFTTANIAYCYFSVDITNLSALEKVVTDIEETLGPISGVIHAAARNVPCLLTNLTAEVLQKTLAVKLTGANNILATVSPANLKLFVSFGSIIARTGMAGEADYGLANECLTNLTNALQKDYPNCYCLAIEWSVWEGVGMGSKLGQLEVLKQQGISPIPIAEGVAIFKQLLTQPHPSSTAVVVTGRFGNPPTLGFKPTELPLDRFLETVCVYVPNVELIVESTLALETDPYLADHILDNEQLLPGVIGLEAMTQVAMALAETVHQPTIKNLSFNRPIIVPKNAPLTIRIAALLNKNGTVSVAIRSQETQFQTDHFQATYCFTEEAPLADFNIDLSLANFPPLLLEPKQDLYNTILFQQGRFKQVKGYKHISATQCLAEISPTPAAWFGQYLSPTLHLGNPGTRDAIIHACQVSVPHGTLIPIKVNKLIPAKLSEHLDTLQVYAVEILRTDDTFEYDIAVVNKQGALQEYWQGLRLRLMNKKSQEPWLPPLLGSYLEHELSCLWPNSTISIVIEDNHTLKRQERSTLAMQRAIGQQSTIHRHSNGKPESSTGHIISATHADSITLAVAAHHLVSCDIQPVLNCADDTWSGLLGAAGLSLSQLIKTEANLSFNKAATCVWSAHECLKKAGLSTRDHLTLTKITPNGWILLKAGLLKIALLLTTVTTINTPLVVTILSGGLENE